MMRNQNDKSVEERMREHLIFYRDALSLIEKGFLATELIKRKLRTST